MKSIAAAAIAGVLTAGLMLGTGAASAGPGTCDGAGCVPYVNHTAKAGGPCNQSTRYNFGMDASGNVLVCSSHSQWVASPALVGVRTLRSPCGETKGVAQSPDGQPLKCAGGAWTEDYWVMFYG